MAFLTSKNAINVGVDCIARNAVKANSQAFNLPLHRV